MSIYIMEKEPTNEEENKYLDFATEIEKMYALDQEMRERALQNKGIIEGEEDDSLDFRNTEKMKEIIEQIGWPTISKVGEKVSEMAWLLVQHADHDPEFQKKCLELMKSQPEGEVSKQNIAYLTDRIMVKEKGAQLYGTQFREVEEGDPPNYDLWPIEDRGSVDERRKKMGMVPLENGVKAYKEKYKGY